LFFSGLILIVAFFSCGCRPAVADDAAKPFLGSWDLDLPGGGAGWLKVVEKDGKLAGEMLWGGGSIGRVKDLKVEKSRLLIPLGDEIITIEACDDDLALQIGQLGKEQEKFTGKRCPPLPSAPDLSKVKFGEKIDLIGDDLKGWKLIDPKDANGWSVKDGVLRNTIEQEKGKPRKSFGNLRTEKEFEDFNLKLDVLVPKEGNSGIYLRGIYEVQVFDSYGKPLDSHNMGAIYSRIKPTVAAEKPAGQWQSLDITLVQRHVTVVLNDKKIIDNQPLEGCTGGALWADQLRAGPIYLQGDHTGMEYRNIEIRPVVKK
jgi:hypothetical protein